MILLNERYQTWNWDEVFLFHGLSRLCYVLVPFEGTCKGVFLAEDKGQLHVEFRIDIDLIADMPACEVQQTRNPGIVPLQSMPQLESELMGRC